MGFIRKNLGIDIKDPVSLGTFGLVDNDQLTGVVDQFTGKAGERAANEAAGIQATAAEEASGLFDPFAQLGQQGLDQANFLTDPQAQFDFLQNNPLFQGALDNANRQTSQLAAARGRLSSGDTLQQLSQNTLLAASPLIQQQKQSILGNLGFGERTAANQANLRTDRGAALAGGVVGGQNARASGVNNLLNLGGQIFGGLGGGGAGGVPAPTFNQNFNTPFADQF
jgi:hypothetical protein